MSDEIAEAVKSVARALRQLGDAEENDGPVVVLEKHGRDIKEGLGMVADSIDGLADAVRELAAATRAT